MGVATATQTTKQQQMDIDQRSTRAVIRNSVAEVRAGRVFVYVDSSNAHTHTSRHAHTHAERCWLEPVVNFSFTSSRRPCLLLCLPPILFSFITTT